MSGSGTVSQVRVGFRYQKSQVFPPSFRYKSNQNSGRVGVRVSQSRVFPHCLGFRVFGYPTTSIVGSNPKILNFELPELGKTKPNLTLSSKPELWSWTHTNPESLNPNTFFPASSDRNYWGKNKIFTMCLQKCYLVISNWKIQVHSKLST